MSNGYNASLEDGREIYIPYWPVDVSIENLTRAGQYLGAGHVLQMAELKKGSVIVAIMESEDPSGTAAFLKHILCQIRISGSKIEPSTLDSMFIGKLGPIAELVAHCMHAQYSDFFDCGLAKGNSQDK